MPSIAETYRLTKKTPDLFWNEYVCRPVAAVLVHALSGSRVTPNQVTLASLLVAVVAAGLLIALPGHGGLVAAVVVYEISYVLDCADGMLARFRNVQSVPGHLFDFLMDEIKAFLILGAVSVRLYIDRQRDDLFLILGIAGLCALASGIALTTFVRRPEIQGSSPGTPSTTTESRSLLSAAVALAERLAKLLIHYPSYIWIAALAGRLEIYFYPYVAVNALYAARTMLQVALRFGRR
jgi:phosphatidylglycerophosphate synthase